MNTVYALKVTLTYEWYDIDPKNVRDIYSEIRIKGPMITILNRKVWAKYTPTFYFIENIHYQQTSANCRVTFSEARLEGVITIYRLTPGKYYSQAIVNTVQKMYYKSNQHELHHESIYRTHMERAERKIRNLIPKYHADCGQLKKEITAIYQEMRKQNKRENNLFDCNSYGFRQKDKMCQQFLGPEALSKGR